MGRPNGFQPLKEAEDDRDLRPESLRRAEAEKAGIGGAPATHKVVEAQAH